LATAIRPTPDLFKPFLGNPGQIMILDGALATELEHRGANIKDPLWSARVLLDAPASIQQLHYDYLEAGADVLITASYQASFEGFAARGLDTNQSRSLLHLSVSLAQRARDQFVSDSNQDSPRPTPLVAASVGPYGAHLHDGSEYHGNYSAPDRVIRDFHLHRIEALIEAEPDLLALETIPSLREAEILFRVLERFPESRAWIAFSCRDGEHLSHGETFASGIRAAADSPQVIAAGINCTPPHHISSLLLSLSDLAGYPLVVYPNSGESWVADSNCWTPGQDVSSLADMARSWKLQGAQLIGGCCRTGVRDIAELARSMRA
jgi:homocysteine S-methyltransferase